MKRYIITIFLFFPFCFSSLVIAQMSNQVTLDEIFQNSPEVYFTTTIADRSEIRLLTKIISIDNVVGPTIYAYANRAQFGRFMKLGYKYTLLQHPGTLLKEEELNMRDRGNKSPLTPWNFYPTYEEYIDLMNGFVLAHPDICKVVPIGTTIEGRQLLSVKISDSVNVNEGEPEVFLTSSIHGDETTGYVLMLHLIDSLLSGYGQNPRMTNLVNNYQIFINPLANPDGTYHGGNNTVSGSIRENANLVDLNRNFPDPKGGLHPDDNAWQPETEAFMRFDTINHFCMSMNFHGGEEVFNYPWDTYTKLHADESWFNFIGREYADTVHLHSPTGYFMGPQPSGNGVTNGNAWYEVEGGRQDYTTYYHNGREITLEISLYKTLPANQLPSFWNYNFRSFLNFIEEASYGVNGKITDSVTNQPLAAKVLVLGHDKDNSFVYSKLPSGWYFRPIYEGTYAFNFSAPGYYSKTITGITAANRSTTRLNVKLVPLSIGFVEDIDNKQVQAYPNPSDGNVRFMLPAGQTQPFIIEVFNAFGQLILKDHISGTNGGQAVTLNLTALSDGFYMVKMTGGKIVYESRIIIRK